MSIEENEEKIGWTQRAFEREQKSTNGIENKNDMTRIHKKWVNKIDEWDLLHDIINPPKIIKILNSHQYHILNRFMNTRHGREKFKNSGILLVSGCSSTIVMGRIVEKLHPEKDSIMQ